MKQLLFAVLIGSTLASVRCTHGPEFIPYGIRPDRAAYVPARIAVLPCMQWPSTARFATTPSQQTSKDGVDSICPAYGKFVLEGFSNQPFMKGFTPTAVSKLLEQGDQQGLLSEWEAQWQQQSGDCSKCRNTSSFYALSIADRVGWRTWLQNLSRHVRNADAVLIPFVVYAVDTNRDDRGMLVASKIASVTLLLVDTNNGNLIWSGGREAEISNQRLRTAKADTPLTSPPWDSILSRLLTDDIWLEFPGRQVNN